NESYSAFDILSSQSLPAVAKRVKEFCADLRQRNHWNVPVPKTSAYQRPTASTYPQPPSLEPLMNSIMSSPHLPSPMPSQVLERQSLIREIIQRRPSLVRAVWLLKVSTAVSNAAATSPVVSAGMAAGGADKSGHVESEWTAVLKAVLMDQLKMMLPAGGRKGGTGARPGAAAARNWGYRWDFLRPPLSYLGASVKLAKWMYLEGYLNQRDFLIWSLKELKESNFDQIKAANGRNFLLLYQYRSMAQILQCVILQCPEALSPSMWHIYSDIFDETLSPPPIPFQVNERLTKSMEYVKYLIAERNSNLMKAHHAVIADAKEQGMGFDGVDDLLDSDLEATEILQRLVSAGLDVSALEVVRLALHGKPSERRRHSGVNVIGLLVETDPAVKVELLTMLDSVFAGEGIRNDEDLAKLVTFYGDLIAAGLFSYDALMYRLIARGWFEGGERTGISVQLLKMPSARTLVPAIINTFKLLHSYIFVVNNMLNAVFTVVWDWYQGGVSSRTQKRMPFADSVALLYLASLSDLPRTSCTPDQIDRLDDDVTGLMNQTSRPSPASGFPSDFEELRLQRDDAISVATAVSNLTFKYGFCQEAITRVFACAVQSVRDLAERENSDEITVRRRIENMVEVLREYNDSGYFLNSVIAAYLRDQTLGGKTFDFLADPTGAEKGWLLTLLVQLVVGGCCPFSTILTYLINPAVTAMSTDALGQNPSLSSAYLFTFRLLQAFLCTETPADSSPGFFITNQDAHALNAAHKFDFAVDDTIAETVVDLLFDLHVIGSTLKPKTFSPSLQVISIFNKIRVNLTNPSGCPWLRNRDPEWLHMRAVTNWLGRLLKPPSSPGPPPAVVPPKATKAKSKQAAAAASAAAAAAAARQYPEELAPECFAFMQALFDKEGTIVVRQGPEGLLSLLDTILLPSENESDRKLNEIRLKVLMDQAAFCKINVNSLVKRLMDGLQKGYLVDSISGLTDGVVVLVLHEVKLSIEVRASWDSPPPEGVAGSRNAHVIDDNLLRVLASCAGRVKSGGGEAGMVGKELLAIVNFVISQLVSCAEKREVFDRMDNFGWSYEIASQGAATAFGTEKATSNPTSKVSLASVRTCGALKNDYIRVMRDCQMNLKLPVDFFENINRILPFQLTHPYFTNLISRGPVDPATGNYALLNPIRNHNRAWDWIEQPSLSLIEDDERMSEVGEASALAPIVDTTVNDTPISLALFGAAKIGHHHSDRTYRRMFTEGWIPGEDGWLESHDEPELATELPYAGVKRGREASADSEIKRAKQQ
ncbi:hypothetical protein HK101_008399, partial [Irineochytrium annulatum]